jgi:predicted RNase H-like nuclease
VGAPRSAQFVGFDSAWAGNSKRLGAICSISFSGEEFFDFKEPEPVGFTGASDYIVSIRRPEMPTLIALDQPTIVPNPTGMRPVEKVVASLISWMGGGVQPANLGRTVFFGKDAPIWQFLRRLAAAENPEAARTADQGVHLIEVFPALALASLESKFFGRLVGPLYNPERKTFQLGSWIAVIDATRAEAQRLSCMPVVEWLDRLRMKGPPGKSDQDLLDAALCLLVAIRWRLSPRETSVAIGDLRSGYMIAPASVSVLGRLRQAAMVRGVPIDTLCALKAPS